ncbi:MAG: PKD domain-containing protein [Bacteroidota bacterium]
MKRVTAFFKRLETQGKAVSIALLFLTVVNGVQAQKYPPWEEDFEDLAIGITVDNGSTAWSRTDPEANYASVQNQNTLLFEVKKPKHEVVWTTEVISVLSPCSLYLYADLSHYKYSDGGDYVKVYYVKDGGPDTVAFTNGEMSDNFYPVRANATVYVNSTIRIVAKFDNNHVTNLGRIDNIRVLEGPLPEANFGANVFTLCTGESVDFVDSGTNATSWEWTFNGGTPTSSTIQNPSIIYNTTGTYDVKQKVVNINGSDSVTATAYITVFTCKKSINTGDWDDIVKPTWDCYCVPGISDNVSIEAGHTVTLTTDANIGELLIKDGGTFVFGGGYTLSIYENFSIQSGGVLSTSGTDGELLEFRTTNKQFYVEGTATVKKLDLNAGDDAFFIMKGMGTLTVTTDIYAWGAGNTTIYNQNSDLNVYGDIDGASTGMTFGASSTGILNIGGSLVPNGTLGTWNKHGYYINYNKNTGEDQIIKSADGNYYRGLMISGSGTKRLESNLYNEDDLVLGGTAMLDLNGYWLKVGGDCRFEGGSLVGNSTVYLYKPSQDSDAPQEITGNATFYNLYIDKPGNDVTLNSDVTVTGTLTLISGDIILGDNNLTISNTGSIAGSPGLSSFIQADGSGVMKKDWTGTGSFTYPLGDGNYYTPFTLTFISPTTFDPGANVAISVVNAMHPNQDKPDHITRYWIITPTGITNPNYDVSYEYIDADIVGTESNMFARIWSGGSWTDYDAATVATNTLTGSGITAFSSFSGGGGEALPITLLFFDAQMNGDKVDLKWSTASETNNDYFTIEKAQNPQGLQNPESLEWEIVTTVPGAGNSNQTLFYEAVDDDPYFGVSYYRLKQTDYDGKYEYSKMVAVNYTIDKDAEFIVFPNPSDGTNFNIRMKGYLENKEVLVVLRDVLGKTIYSKVLITDTNGNFLTAIDLMNNIPAGIYIILGSSKNDIYKQKLIVK